VTVARSLRQCPPEPELDVPGLDRRGTDVPGLDRRGTGGSGAGGSGELGSATVVVLAVIAVVMMLTVSGLLLASAVLASHRARAAADLAALAAAGALIQGGSAGVACQRAVKIAEANHAHLLSCVAVGSEARLTISVSVGAAGLGVATARSRAGPDPAGGPDSVGSP